MPNLNNQIFNNPSTFPSVIQPLINSLANKKIDLIVGLSRGGCIPAVILSHSLNIPLKILSYHTRENVEMTDDIYDFFWRIIDKFVYEPKHILIVDDIVDSGKTINDIIIRIPKKHIQISVAVLAVNTDVKLDVECHSAYQFSRDIDKSWFDFFWENIN